MTDYLYWLLREYGEYGVIRHVVSTDLDTETGEETVAEDRHELKMVPLPISVVTMYAQQMRSASNYGSLYAQGNSVIALPVPEFEVHQDDIVEVMGFTFRVVDLNHLHKEGVLEMIVKS